MDPFIILPHYFPGVLKWSSLQKEQILQKFLIGLAPVLGNQKPRYSIFSNFEFQFEFEKTRNKNLKLEFEIWERATNVHQ
jgi:hypothetical protein